MKQLLCVAALLASACTNVIEYDVHQSSPAPAGREELAKYGTGVSLEGGERNFVFKYTGVPKALLNDAQLEAIERANNVAATWTTGSCAPEHDFRISARSVENSSSEPGRVDVTFQGECRHSGICLPPPEQWQRDSIAVDAINAIKARKDYPFAACAWLRDEIRNRTHKRRVAGFQPTTLRNTAS